MYITLGSAYNECNALVTRACGLVGCYNVPLNASDKQLYLILLLASLAVLHVKTFLLSQNPGV